MSTVATALDAKITRTPGKLGMLGFGVVLLVGVIYAGFHLLSDLAGMRETSILPYLFVGHRTTRGVRF